MAKKHSKSQARMRKGKKSTAGKNALHKTREAEQGTRTKANKTHRKKHKPDTASPTLEKTNTRTGHALLDMITSEEYLLADRNRHNPFIGSNLIDSLENVSTGLELIRDIIGNNNDGMMLSDDSQHGLYLFVESLKRVLMVERESVIGMQ
jgi:hypothetical protein